MTLLLDQLQQTFAEPHCASAWHALHGVWQMPSEADGRVQVLAGLAAASFDDPRAEVLRLSFLRDTTEGDAAFGAMAAHSALAVQPDNPDRLAAFAAFTWGLAITQPSSRQAFVGALQAAAVPELVRRMALHAGAHLPPTLVPRCPAGVNRVAIVAPYLGNVHHTPSVAVLRQCEVLVAEGKAVQIFSCQELQPPDIGRFFGSTRQVLLPPFEVGFWQHALPQGVSLTCSDPRFSLAARWREGLAAVAAFDPDVVLMCGLYSPLAAVLHAVRPCVALNVHAFQPMGPADLWLSSVEPASVEPPPWGGLAGAPQPYVHPFRIQRPRDLPAVSRAELGIAEDAIVWITLGGRLPDEIAAPWAERMAALLGANPAVTWLLVGGAGTLPPALAGCPPERVKVFDARDGIGAWLKLADVYINPPRAGGGYSVAEAMAVGLPVVSLGDGDGGDKLGPLALATLDAYDARLQALSGSAALRAEQGQALQHRFAQRLDLACSGPSLVAALAQAGELARGRLQTAGAVA